jgi:hypothetical protein
MTPTRRTVLGWLLAAVIAPPRFEPAFVHTFSVAELEQIATAQMKFTYATGKSITIFVERGGVLDLPPGKIVEAQLITTTASSDCTIDVGIVT